MNNWINLDLARQVVEIAQLASDEILKIYHSQVLNTQLKSDESPVTAADLAANDVINKGLNNLAIKLPIVSEENAEIPYSERKKFDYYWLIDPLDGTKEFIKRNGEFTVNIALIHDKKPVLGVVFVPNTEGSYFAVKGLGSFKLVGDTIEKISCSRFKLTDKNLQIPISRSHLNAETQALLAQLNEPILTPKGSALKLVLLAEGVFDYYPRIGLTSEWDTAAPHIILEEAGGQMLQFDSREPLVYNKENLLNPNFIAQGRVNA
jgi:3'(2'), 5'-bisphosphate nucleotidase